MKRRRAVRRRAASVAMPSARSRIARCFKLALSEQSPAVGQILALRMVQHCARLVSPGCGPGGRIRSGHRAQAPMRSTPKSKFARTAFARTPDSTDSDHTRRVHTTVSLADAQGQLAQERWSSQARPERRDPPIRLGRGRCDEQRLNKPDSMVRRLQCGTLSRVVSNSGIRTCCRTP